MPFLLMYWKQLAIIGAIVIILPVTFYKGYESGKAHVQAEWNQQNVLDAQAVAIADNKATTITINSEKVTSNDDLLLKQNLGATTDYYSNHDVSGIAYSVFKPIDKTSSGEVSSVPTTTDKSNEKTTDTISDTYVTKTDFDKLANDCLATTIQLNNAQAWAAEQVKVDAE